MGVFVAEAPPPASKKTRRERLQKTLDALLVEAVRLGCSSDELIELVAERAKQFEWAEATS
jgi:hypothetical protein